MIRNQNDGVSSRKLSKKSKSFFLKTEEKPVKVALNSIRSHSIRHSMISSKEKNFFSGNADKKNLKEYKKEVKNLKNSLGEKSKLKTGRNKDDIEQIIDEKNSRIEKLEIMVKYFKTLVSDKPETLKLMDIIHQQNEKIAQLQGFVDVLQSDQCGKHEIIIDQLKKKNLQMANDLKRFRKLPSGDDWEFLLEKIKGLKEKCQGLTENYEKIKEDLGKYEGFGNLETLGIGRQEAFHISSLVCKLNMTLDEVIEKKSFELTPQFFEIDSQKTRPNSEKLLDVLLRVKQDLKKIFEKIFEIHADLFIKENCSLQ
jgi:hypothetical protein